MPIRFRCNHCSQLLGIARRKAGTQIQCPECRQPVTVPIQDDRTVLDDLDDLLNSSPRPNGSAGVHSAPVPSLDFPAPESPQAVAATASPQERRKSPRPESPATPRPQRRSKPEDEPLLIEDLDQLLGIAQQERLELDESPPAVKPVSGMDANSLDTGSGKIVLTPLKATLLTVAVVFLMGVSFASGFLISSWLS